MSTIQKIARACTLTIIDGPSRQDMFIEFEHTYDTRYIIRIDFTVEISGKMPRREKFRIEQISSIRHIDVTGNDFIINGKCTSDNFYGRKFTARYSTLTRKGIMEIDISSERDKRLSENEFIPNLNRGLYK